METYLPPNRVLSLRTIAMPSDTNPHGDVFGGWLVAQMDLAGANVASYRARGRVATVAIETLAFHKPVFVGDEVSCYTEIIRIGRTSMRVKVDVLVRRSRTHERAHVTEGVFTFVAIDENNIPREIPRHDPGHPDKDEEETN